MSRKARVGLDQLWQAFDAARFGADRTLNLRATLPTADEAARRAEIWLRQKQVERAPEVLVVTGRGNNSEAGFSVVREAVIRTLHDLRRRNVVKEWEEHTAGSFVVRPASMTSLVEAPRREKAVPRSRRVPPRWTPSTTARAGSCATSRSACWKGSGCTPRSPSSKGRC